MVSARIRPKKGARGSAHARPRHPRPVPLTLAQFITGASKQIVAEWAEFARTCVPAAGGMSLEERCDHIVGMLEAIALDLATPQTKTEQAAKSKGKDDHHGDRITSATAHGTERAATGYTPVQMVSEFRALRASVLRLWSETQRAFDHESLDQVTRFNEAIDQLLAESIARYARDVQGATDLFLGVLGHDLRNPLGAVTMTAALIAKKEGPDGPHAKAAARILASGKRMDELIGALVDFTRGRLGGGIPVELGEMDLGELCRATVDEIRAFHPGATVQLELAGDLHGQWDHGRIAQVLSNLVGNAHQHGSKDTPVQVAARGTPAQVLLTVHNEGPAIPSGALQDIFNPFRQVDAAAVKSRPTRSLGLGLYIAQAIVHAHHGTIRVASTKGGTTFTVRLPRRPPAV